MAALPGSHAVDPPVHPSGNTRRPRLGACLRAVLDAMPDGVVVCDRQGRITFSNQAARCLFRHPCPEGLELAQHPSVLRLHRPDGGLYRPEELPLSRSALEGLALEHVEVLVPGADGSARTTLCNTSPLRGRSGVVSGAVGVFRDVTPLKESERERERLLEEHLRQREFLERLLAEAPVGIAVFEGPDHRHVLVNPAYQEKIARGKGPVLGRPLAEVWPEIVGQVLPVLDAVRRTGKPFRVTDVVSEVVRGGEPEKVAFTAGLWPVARSGGSPRGILALVMECTDQVRTRDRASALTAVAAELGAGRQLPDVLKTTLTRAVELLGGDDGSLYLFEPDDRHLRAMLELRPLGRVGVVHDIRACPHGRRAVEGRKPLHFNLVDALGEEAVWFRRLGSSAAIAAPLVADDRCLGLIFVNFRRESRASPPGDLAFAASIAEHCALAIDRAQALEERAELLASERAARAVAEERASEMTAILENLSDGVVVRDAAGRLVLRNRRAREITGLADEEAVTLATSHALRLTGADGQAIPQERWPIARLLAGKPVVDEEWRLERPDGSQRTVSFSGTTLPAPDGRVALGVLTLHDVTELRRLERAKDEFLQVLAHELRNPLAAAFGLVQLASQRLGPDGRDQADHLRLAEAELGRLADLVNEIIAGYRVSSGRLPLGLRPIDLVSALNRAVAPYARGLFESTVSVAKSPAPNIIVLGDEGRLMEVVGNLLSNAVKYSPRGSRVVVRATLEGDHVVVRVADRGIGIPPDQLEKVFAGFYRATNLTERQPGGLGLGLYISRDIVRRHGGELWAENRPRGGTVMCLKLPLAGRG